jgi:hypothetical protein
MFARRGDAFKIWARLTIARPQICNGNMSNCKFNLTVGKLPPIRNNCCESILRYPIDNLAGFAASRVKGQPETWEPDFQFGKSQGQTVDSVCSVIVDRLFCSEICVLAKVANRRCQRQAPDITYRARFAPPIPLLPIIAQRSLRLCFGSYRL